jgi:hypothetical protein
MATDQLSQLGTNAAKKRQTGKYGFDTKAEEVEPQVDMHGKTVIVTGAFTSIKPLHFFKKVILDLFIYFIYLFILFSYLLSYLFIYLLI